MTCDADNGCPLLNNERNGGEAAGAIISPHLDGENDASGMVIMNGGEIVDELLH